MGVTVLLINEVESITGDFRATELGVSYLCDNLIFMRYLEIDGELRKAIGVLKKRLGDFGKTLREMEITDARVEGRRAPRGAARAADRALRMGGRQRGAGDAVSRILLLLDQKENQQLLAEELGGATRSSLGDEDADLEQALRPLHRGRPRAGPALGARTRAQGRASSRSSCPSCWSPRGRT